MIIVWYIILKNENNVLNRRTEEGFVNGVTIAGS
jgi:hypothetical protein